MGVGDGVDPTIITSRGGTVLIQGAGAVNLETASQAGAFFIPPGLESAAAVDAAVAGGASTLLFGEGIYSFEQRPLQGFTPAELSGLRLIGAGDDRTVFTAGYAPAVGLADDLRNALLLFEGLPDGAVATTVAAGIPAINGTRTFTVTSAAGIVAGKFLRIVANNVPGNPTDMAGMSDGVDIILTELVEVESVLGAVVTLRSILKQWHTPGAAVQSVIPVTDVLVRGIYFDCSGGSIACAVTTILAARVRLDACSVRGFSRSAFDFEQGSRDLTISGQHSHGECNARILGDSAAIVRISDLSADEAGLRVHANGIPSWDINLFERCSDWTISDSLLQHASAGVRLWGGTNIQIGPGLVIRDMDPAAIRARDPIYPPGSILGVGLEGGAGPLNIASFAFGVSFLDVEMHDTFGINDTSARAWFLHDARSVLISGCGIWNHGPGDGSVINGVTYTPRGMWVNDVQAVVDSIHINGCSDAIHTSGTPSVLWNEVKLSGQSGNYVAATVPITLDHGGLSGMHFARLFVSDFNSANVFTYTVNFTGNPDYGLTIEYFNRDGLIEATNLSPYGAVAAVSFGAVAEIDPTSPAGTKRLIASTGPSAHNVAVADPTGAGSFTFACGLPASLATVTVLGAAGAGVILEANAANQAVPNNAAAAGTKLGRILESKAAGAALVRIGSVD